MIFSPFSSDVVLLWLLSGARGDTAEELQTALRLPSVDESTVKLFQNVSSYTQIANKLYLKPSFQVKEGFKTTSVDIFQADIENVEFSDKNAAAKIINDWVAKQTNDKIQKLVDPKNLNVDTRAVLVNALYLQADWAQVFLPSYPEKFYKSATDEFDVDMMRSGIHFYEYFESSSARHVRIPFEKEGALTIVLPKQKFGLVELEKQLPEVFSPNNNFSIQLVNIALPKFKIETELDFKKILKNLNVKKMFDPLQADLSGIAGGKGDLFVDHVVQKSFIRVNEKGIEAGAATYACKNSNSKFNLIADFN